MDTATRILVRMTGATSPERALGIRKHFTIPKLHNSALGIRSSREYPTGYLVYAVLDEYVFP